MSRYKPKDPGQRGIVAAFDEYFKKRTSCFMRFRGVLSNRERQALEQLRHDNEKAKTIEDLTDLRIGVERIQSERGEK